MDELELIAALVAIVYCIGGLIGGAAAYWILFRNPQRTFKQDVRMIVLTTLLWPVGFYKMHKGEWR